jgi:Zn finger protein HypA/HybF involved in hydrogenase expression
MTVRKCEACGTPYQPEADELLCPTCHSAIDQLAEEALEARHFDPGDDN